MASERRSFSFSFAGLAGPRGLAALICFVVSRVAARYSAEWPVLVLEMAFGMLALSLFWSGKTWRRFWAPSLIAIPILSLLTVAILHLHQTGTLSTAVVAVAVLALVTVIYHVSRAINARADRLESQAPEGHNTPSGGGRRV